MKENKSVALLNVVVPACWVCFDFKSKERNVLGFTLIELLVVVLIIGILSAVAVPQYQKVVAKNRLMLDFMNGKKIMEAHKLYYLETGKYTSNVTELGIEDWCIMPNKNYSYICETKNAHIFVGNNNVTMEIRKPAVNLEFRNTVTYCVARGTDMNSLPHQACRAITGKSTYSSSRSWQNPPSFMYSF